MRRKLIGFILLLLIVNSVHFISAVEPIKKEIRGVWLTTVYGLDWPHQPATNSLTREKQQRDLIDILDRLQDANFNTVFLQVRLRGDVIWRSDIEPASKIFSGKYGLMPGYDPLTFVIEECHKRGMECHAWFVTFPLGTDKNVKEQGKRSVVKRHPKLCKRHNGEWYLDPGVPETSDYILSLVKEIVKGYDIDGIHFDYIRYPEQAKSFPDKVLYRKSGKKLSLSEWRRANINKMMSCIYDWVKSVKPWVQVSSAPLGKYNRIERVPNAGWTAYDTNGDQIKNKFAESAGDFFYLNSDGYLTYGLQTIGEVMYYFDEDGRLLLNTQIEVDGVTYEVDAKGVVTRVAEPIVIVKQPESVEVSKAGERATVSVEASGEGLSYVWYYYKPGENGFKKSSTTSDTYSVTVTEERDGFQLYCVITDANGNRVETEKVILSIV